MAQWKAPILVSAKAYQVGSLLLRLRSPGGPCGLCWLCFLRFDGLNTLLARGPGSRPVLGAVVEDEALDLVANSAAACPRCLLRGIARDRSLGQSCIRHGLPQAFFCQPCRRYRRVLRALRRVQALRPAQPGHVQVLQQVVPGHQVQCRSR